ncbi:hypothetical protein LCGC14_1724280, partial [marine sediment metagenome]
MTLTFTPPSPDAKPIHLVGPDELSAWMEDQDDGVRAWVEGAGFSGAAGSL